MIDMEYSKYLLRNKERKEGVRDVGGKWGKRRTSTKKRRREGDKKKF